MIAELLRSRLVRKPSMHEDGDHAGATPSSPDLAGARTHRRHLARQHSRKDAYRSGVASRQTMIADLLRSRLVMAHGDGDHASATPSPPDLPAYAHSLGTSRIGRASIPCAARLTEHDRHFAALTAPFGTVSALNRRSCWRQSAPEPAGARAQRRYLAHQPELMCRPPIGEPPTMIADTLR
ncbi:hypothetical protein [Pseudonocardia sp. NPDC049154]|uniref:hypothetical protein n=1 Tax=Pseudonocardia sp. NPDC049154 TaxID=3155501 RepID=UPI0033DB3E0A